MSVPILAQVFDEVRRLAIAGSSVAPGDFRLKKLAPPLEQAAQKAPVFAKVAQAVTRVVESNEKAAAEAVLELSTLVNAILYTQGETGLAGQLQPISTTDLDQHQTQATARVLKPLLEALSKTGSGRLEVIKDAHQRGAFRDLRLVKPALEAIEDPYPEIGDFIAEEILPLYGAAILPELRARFDPQGRGGDVRRLTLLHRLDPEGSRELLREVLDKGSKEVKIAAIERLGGLQEDLVLLLAHVNAKAHDVRKAALKALSKNNAGEAIDALRAAVAGDDLELAVQAIRGSQNPQLLKFVLDEASKAFAGLLAAKKDRKAADKHAARLACLLDCLAGRTDKVTEAFLVRCFAERAGLAAIKSEPSASTLEQKLVAAMASGPKKAQKALIDAHAELSAERLSQAFDAACRSRKPAEVFELFSPYLSAKVDAKKAKRDPAFAKQQVIAQALSHHTRWSRFFSQRAEQSDPEEGQQQLDPRWLDLALEHGRHELVLALARPKHAAVGRLLTERFDELTKKSPAPHEYAEVVRAMICAEHPAAADCLIDAFVKHSSGAYRYVLFDLWELIPYLPKSEAPKLRAALTKLPDSAVDRLMDYLTRLENKA